jgi:hypothetical protein
MAYEKPPEFGGGAVYRNQRRCSSVEVTPTEATGTDQYNEHAPQMSGSMEVTKAMARMLLDKFKAGDTEPSKRERTKGEPVVMLDVGANVASSSNIRTDGNPTGGYFYFWVRPKWVAPSKVVAPEPELNDEIPF